MVLSIGCGQDDGDWEVISVPIPIVQLCLYHQLSASDLRRFEDHKHDVEQDADDRGEHNRGDSAWEEVRDMERENAVRQGEVATDSTNEDDCTDCQLFRVEEVDF